VNQLGTNYARPIVSPTAEGGVLLMWRDRGQPKVEAFISSSAARYLVLEKTDLIESAAINSYALFASNILRRYLTL
jgi:hypothetical protein